MQKSLNTSIRYLKGIGPKRAKVFQKFGINTIEDLLYYFPRRYEDRTNFSPIAQLKEGSVQTIKAEILSVGGKNLFRRRALSILEVTVADKSGKLRCVWFNQPYLKEYFKPGLILILYGKLEHWGSRLQMSNPEFEIESSPSMEGLSESLNIGRIVPVYTLPERMTQRYFRKFLKNALDEYLPAINDFLPFDIRSKNNLLNLAKSLINIHFPESFAIQKDAYRRLAFEEFFLFQLPLALRKLKRKEKKGIAHKISGQLLDNFIQGLPFKLTASQSKVIQEIKQDMQQPQPMQRLLQGDVGSGKTVVAAIASIIAVQGGYQAAFMVPTEILAKQHYINIKNQISKIKYNNKKLCVRLLTGSISGKEKNNICQEVRDGKADLIIGTHALLEEAVEFKNLGLVVIDEQHKFGVGQRALLPQKGPSPDCLIMTATPIPRTLSITLYGDLDISVISELPVGRLPIKTLHFKEEKRQDAYQIAKEQLKKGRQVYIVYPVIEESYALDLSGAKKMYAELKESEFKEFNLGLIHGKLKDKEQDALMQEFKEGKLDILVATTILEVGIDIPNAACIIIEHAERFGLAQLHQLRGRVGRGQEESFCLLVSDAGTDEAAARIAAMVKYSDGFRISEEDLKIRGPGEFFGSRQHGLTELKIGDPLTQMQLLKKAREEAVNLVQADPHFSARQNILVKEKLLERFPEYEKLMVIG